MKFSSGTSSLPFSILYLSLNILGRSHLARAQSTFSISTFDTTQDTGLSAACNAAYTATISGCQMSDFLATNPCSSSCLNGLQSVQSNTQASCGGDNIPSTSLLSTFAAGNGINQLCVVMKNTATTMSTMVSSSMPTSASSMSMALSGTMTVATMNPSDTTAPLITASASPSAAAQKAATGIMALPRMALYAIVIGAVVACILLALLTYCCFNVRYKR